MSQVMVALTHERKMAGAFCVAVDRLMLPILTPAEAAALDRASAEARRERDDADGGGRARRSPGPPRSWPRAARTGAAPWSCAARATTAGDGLVAARLLERAGMGVDGRPAGGARGVRGAGPDELRAVRRRGRPVGACPAARGASSPGPTSRSTRSSGPGSTERRAAAPARHWRPQRGGRPRSWRSTSRRASRASPAPFAARRSTPTRRSCAGALKPGVVFEPGTELAGRLEVADIGFPPNLVRSDLLLVEAADVRAVAAAAFAGRAQAVDGRRRGAGRVPRT